MKNDNRVGPPTPDGYYIIVVNRALLERIKHSRVLESVLIEPINGHTVLLKSKSRSAISNIVRAIKNLK